MSWKLYYHDRTTYSSSDGTWLEAPAWGVMAVVIRDETVGYTRDNNDFYVMAPWSEGQPWACDIWGVLDILIDQNIIGEGRSLDQISPATMINNGIKFGRSLRTVDWLEVQDWIHEDPDFGPKSARWPYERP